MQSTDSGKRYVSVIASASTTGQREGMGTTLRTAMAAWAGAGILILLFLASLGYVVLGGAFEPSAGSEPEAQIAKFAVEPADVGVARTHLCTHTVTGADAGPKAAECARVSADASTGKRSFDEQRAQHWERQRRDPRDVETAPPLSLPPLPVPPAEYHSYMATVAAPPAQSLGAAPPAAGQGNAQHWRDADYVVVNTLRPEHGRL